MRFTTATIAFFAGLAIAAPGADQTVYETDEVTITSCAPTVTDCPGSSAGVEPTGVPAMSTPAAPGVGETTPAPSAETPAWSSVPTGAPSVSVPAGGSAPSVSAPAPAPPAETPSSSFSVVPVTTCVPTVIYSTVAVPPASTPAGGNGGNVPHVPGTGVPHVPTGSKGMPSGTASASPSASSPAFNGAGALSGSLGFAGAAAAAAFFLA